MHKRIIWSIGGILLFVFFILVGLQLQYYNGVITLRREQTSQLAKNALAELSELIEMRELVRFIHHEMNSSNTQSKLAKVLAPITQGVDDLNTLHTRSLIDKPSFERIIATRDSLAVFDSLAVSESMLKAFFTDRASLDRYVMANIYRLNNYDSIPQLVNPRYLQEQLRYRLDQKGVSEAYAIDLYSATGVLLYSYTEPGVIWGETDGEETIIHRLFVHEDYKDRPTPYLKLRLEYVDPSITSTPFLPGFISIFAVLGLSIFATILLVRQESFQKHKTDFINNMTHELKTPVSSITLATEMLRSPKLGDDKEKRSKLIGIIDQESHRLSTLIERVLQVSLFEERKATISLSEIELNEIILNVVEGFSVQIESKRGQLLLNLNAEETWVNANTTHMTNVLYNLLENAVKYSSPDRQLVICITTENKEQGILIDIEDNGIGIPRESLGKIFNRYYRVPHGLRHDTKGFGLGLAYVQAVIKLFGGSISAERKEVGGTIMHIYLPNLRQG